MQRSQKSNSIPIPGKTSEGTSAEEVQKAEWYVGSPRSAPVMVPLKNVMHRVIDELSDQDFQISLPEAFVARADFAKLIERFMKSHSTADVDQVDLIEHAAGLASPKQQTNLAQRYTVFGGKSTTALTEPPQDPGVSQVSKKEFS